MGFVSFNPPSVTKSEMWKVRLVVLSALFYPQARTVNIEIYPDQT
jgi:hypothetical protein